MLNFPNYNDILSNMKERISSEIDTREGSIIHNALAPAAFSLQEYYWYLQSVLNETFPDTASREFLTKRAKEKGLSPKAATYCRVKIRCINTFTLPIRSKINCNEFNYTYRGLLSTDSEYKYYIYECDTIGSAPNSNLGDVSPITIINNFPGAEIVEIFAYGEDEESTEDFRKRYLDSLIASPFGGNIADYKEKIGALEGVGGVKVIPVWNGSGTVKLILCGSDYEEFTVDEIHDLQNKIDPPYTYKISGSWVSGDTITINTTTYTCVNSSPGTNQFLSGSTLGIKTAIANKISTSIPNSWVIDDCIYSATNVTVSYSSTNGVIAKTTLHGVGNGIAPIGHDVTVQSVKNIPVAFTTTITYDSGYAWNDISEQVKKVLSDYYLYLRQNWENTEQLILRINHFENQLLTIPGILDFTSGSTKFIKGGGAVWENENLDSLSSNEIPVYELDKETISNYIKTNYPYTDETYNDYTDFYAIFSDDGNHNYQCLPYWIGEMANSYTISYVTQEELSAVGLTTTFSYNSLTYYYYGTDPTNEMQTRYDPLVTQGQGKGLISVGQTLTINRVTFNGLLRLTMEIKTLPDLIIAKWQDLNAIFLRIVQDYYVSKLKENNWDLTKEIYINLDEIEQLTNFKKFVALLKNLGFVFHDNRPGKVYVLGKNKTVRQVHTTKNCILYLTSENLVSKLFEVN